MRTLTFRLALTLSAPQCSLSDFEFGEGLDASMARTLVDFKLGRLQQSQKRFDALLEDHGFARTSDLVEQGHRLKHSTAPLLIFELLFKMSNNENPPAQNIWRYLETISWFDPDDTICHGAIYNTLVVFFLRHSDLAAAEEIAALALQAYQQCESPYLEGFIHLHLAFIQIYSGRLEGAGAFLQKAKACFDNSQDASCENAMVEATKLFLVMEQTGQPPASDTLKALKADLIGGGFWPETILVFANLQFRAEHISSSEDAPRLHSALEVVLRARGMTQVLPAMQLIREEHLLSGAAAMSKSRTKSLGLSERQLLLLSPGPKSFELNWGPDYRSLSLQLPRMRAIQELAKGKSGLKHNRFDLAAEGFFSGLSLIEAHGWHYLLDSVRADLERFLSECRKRKRFVERAASYQNTLLALNSPCQQSIDRPSELTATEFGVLMRLATSSSNKALAREIGVTERTIKFHLSNIYRKIGASTRREAIDIAVTKGWINP